MDDEPQETMAIADDLGSWTAALRFTDIGEHAVHTVRQRLVDTLGCGLGAFHAKPSRAARRLARARPAGPSTVLGTRDSTTADVAAFVNGRDGVHASGERLLRPGAAHVPAYLQRRLSRVPDADQAAADQR